MFFMTGQFTELRQLTKETEVRSVLSSINFIAILTTPSTTPKQIIRTYTDTANTIHVYKPPFGQFDIKIPARYILTVALSLGKRRLI